MILVDTSVWVDHLRVADHHLSGLLVKDAVLCHPFVVGELGCGVLNRRGEILGLLRDLPQAPLVEHDQVLAFVDTHALMGSGLGWVDVHLLASATLSGQRVWTRDRRLAQAARRLGVAA
ncbi:MAG: type II toxin-antitoxin system VapC family toxin [Vicinamibacterales bacterium]